MGVTGVGCLFSFLFMAAAAIFRGNQSGDGRLIVFKGVDIFCISLVAFDAPDVIGTMGRILPLLIQSGVFFLVTGYTVFSNRRHCRSRNKQTGKRQHSQQTHLLHSISFPFFLCSARSQLLIPSQQQHHCTKHPVGNRTAERNTPLT
jgi:hypothetical protein